MSEPTNEPESIDEIDDDLPELIDEPLPPSSELPNGCYLTIQLATDSHFLDPVEAVDEIFLDIIRHGLGGRAVVVTDTETGTEYIVQSGRVLTEEEVKARITAAKESREEE